MTSTKSYRTLASPVPCNMEIRHRDISFETLTSALLLHHTRDSEAIIQQWNT